MTKQKGGVIAIILWSILVVSLIVLTPPVQKFLRMYFDSAKDLTSQMSDALSGERTKKKPTTKSSANESSLSVSKSSSVSLPAYVEETLPGFNAGQVLQVNSLATSAAPLEGKVEKKPRSRTVANSSEVAPVASVAIPEKKQTEPTSLDDLATKNAAMFGNPEPTQAVKQEVVKQESGVDWRSSGAKQKEREMALAGMHTPKPVPKPAQSVVAKVEEKPVVSKPEVPRRQIVLTPETVLPSGTVIKTPRPTEVPAIPVVRQLAPTLAIKPVVPKKVADVPIPISPQIPVAKQHVVVEEKLAKAIVAPAPVSYSANLKIICEDREGFGIPPTVKCP